MFPTNTMPILPTHVIHNDAKMARHIIYLKCVRTLCTCTWVATVLIKIVWNERNKGEKKYEENI